MSDDELIRQNVLEDLKWSPRVNATHIGVSVRDAVVELSGHVESFAEKLEAEHVALSVKGVKGVAEEIAVRLANEKKTSDSELAECDAPAVLGRSPSRRSDQSQSRTRLDHPRRTGAHRHGERDVALSDVKGFPARSR